jgi:NADH dehydrogenase FAD-containing subunit
MKSLEDAHAIRSQALSTLEEAEHPPHPERRRQLELQSVGEPHFAVANLRDLKVSGLPDWLLWGSAHLAFIPES